MLTDSRRWQASTTPQGSISLCLSPRFPFTSRHGDIFSAILIGHIMNGDTLKDSTRKAMDGVYRLIDLNKDNTDKNRGIPLEKYLSVL